MPYGSNQQVYQVGATLLAVGTGLATQVIPIRTTNMMRVRPLSGGTLAIVNAAGQTFAQGIPISSTDFITIDGPATFFLAAAGATCVAGIMFGFGAGFSSAP